MYNVEVSTKMNGFLSNKTCFFYSVVGLLLAMILFIFKMIRQYNFELTNWLEEEKDAKLKNAKLNFDTMLCIILIVIILAFGAFYRFGGYLVGPNLENSQVISDQINQDDKMNDVICNSMSSDCSDKIQRRFSV